MKLQKTKKLGLVGWIKARLLERRLRKEWDANPVYQEHVKKFVKDGVLKKYYSK